MKEYYTSFQKNVGFTNQQQVGRQRRNQQIQSSVLTMANGNTFTWGEDILAMNASCGSVIVHNTFSSKELAIHVEDTAGRTGMPVTLNGATYIAGVYTPATLPTCPDATTIEWVTYPFPEGQFSPDSGYTNAEAAGSGFLAAEIMSLIARTKAILEEHIAKNSVALSANLTDDTLCVGIDADVQAPDASAGQISGASVPGGFGNLGSVANLRIGANVNLSASDLAAIQELVADAIALDLLDLHLSQREEAYGSSFQLQPHSGFNSTTSTTTTTTSTLATAEELQIALIIGVSIAGAVVIVLLVLICRSRRPAQSDEMDLKLASGMSPGLAAWKENQHTSNMGSHMTSAKLSAHVYGRDGSFRKSNAKYAKENVPNIVGTYGKQAGDNYLALGELGRDQKSPSYLSLNNGTPSHFYPSSSSLGSPEFRSGFQGASVRGQAPSIMVAEYERDLGFKARASPGAENPGYHPTKDPVDFQFGRSSSMFTNRNEVQFRNDLQPEIGLMRKTSIHRFKAPDSTAKTASVTDIDAMGEFSDVGNALNIRASAMMGQKTALPGANSDWTVHEESAWDGPASPSWSAVEENHEFPTLRDATLKGQGLSPEAVQFHSGGMDIGYIDPIEDGPTVHFAEHDNNNPDYLTGVEPVNTVRPMITLPSLVVSPSARASDVVNITVEDGNGDFEIIRGALMEGNTATSPPKPKSLGKRKSAESTRALAWVTMPPSFAEVFAEMNIDNDDSVLTTDEISRSLEKEGIREYFVSRGFQMTGNNNQDAHILMSALDRNGDKAISVIEFLGGMGAMTKVSARGSLEASYGPVDDNLLGTINEEADYIAIKDTGRQPNFANY